MKRTLALILTLAMTVSCMAFFSTSASAEENVYELGELTVNMLTNGVWSQTPPTNEVAVAIPGANMNGRYYTKLYARYDEALEAYVVEEKVGCHRNYPKTVENGCIGIMLNYAPLSANSAPAIKNWLVIDRIKVGDKLELVGIDVAAKTIEAGAKIKVTAVRDTNAPTSPYSDKTIVAMGDSITVGGGWTYDLGDAIYADVINSGFGGDTAHASLAARWDTYVKAYNPDIVIVSFGINDAVSSAIKNDLPAGLAQYEKALRDIYAKNTEIGAKTVFMSANNIKIATFDGPAYDAYGGLQGWIDTVIGTMEKVAEELNCPFIDLYSMWKEKGLAPTNLVDSTHPTEVGYDANLELIIPFFKNNVADLCGFFDDTDYEVFEDKFYCDKGTTAGDLAQAIDMKYEIVESDGTTKVEDSKQLEDGMLINFYLDSDTETPFGTVEVSFSVLGDVNGDGKVNNLDATAILKYDAGIVNEIDASVADVNGDGKVNNLDATMVLKYDAGIIDSLS